MLRKTAKTSVCMLLVAGMVCSGVTGITSQAAAKKAKLKTKKMSMEVGQKKKITITGKVAKAVYSFSSSSKAKASVSQNGTVTAKKAGKVTITVKEKYKKKTRSLGKVTVQIKDKAVSTDTSQTASPAPTATVAATTSPSTAPTATVAPTLEPTLEPTATVEPTPAIQPIAPYLEDTSTDVPDNYAKVDKSVEGTVEDITYGSTVIKEGEIVMRKAKVVLPKDYTTDKKYPVVYMQHGIFGDETSLYNSKVQNVFWNAMANGDAEEMIAVFPNACANEAGAGSGFNVQHYAAYNNFLNDLNECLMPYINQHYSTLTGRENTAICGFSMGGRVTLHIGFTLQDKFRYIGAFCPAPGIFTHNDNGANETGLFTKETFTLWDEYMDDTLVMIVKGTDDDVVKQFPQDYTDALTENGVPHLFFELPGGHEEKVYKPGLYNFLRRIFHV